jgi:hypothetical protein
MWVESIELAQLCWVEHLPYFLGVETELEAVSRCKGFGEEEV